MLESTKQCRLLLFILIADVMADSKHTGSIDKCLTQWPIEHTGSIHKMFFHD